LAYSPSRTLSRGSKSTSNSRKRFAVFKSLLENLGLALAAANLPYVIIGGQAVLLHGEPRLTKDIDLTLGVDIDRLAEVMSLVTSIGLRPLVDPERFVPETLVLPCEDPATGIRVDFVFSFSAFEQEAIRRSISVSIGRATVRFASVEDLLVQKIFAGRPRDLEDARIVAAKNPDFDRSYVDQWLTEFEAVAHAPLRARLREILDSGR
jgi:hypothetical protein